MLSIGQLSERLELADQLVAMGGRMFEPQELPGRYGRVVHSVDRILELIQSSGVVGGGWAVWRHGFIGRVTQDIDIAIPADKLDAFLQVAAVSGFQVLQQREGRWPKLEHKESGIQVDVLPEGGRPGTAAHPAPTTIRHPNLMGGGGTMLRYASLPSLIELKLAAGRARDESDIVELIRANSGSVPEIRAHLAELHTDYVAAFDRLSVRAGEESDTQG